MKAVSTRENNIWHRQEFYGGIIIGLSFLALTVLTVKFFAPQVDTDAITQTNEVIAGPYTMSISNNSSVNIAITPTSTQTIYNGTNNVNVMNTCPAGAAVTMTTGSATSNDLIRPALENDTAPNTIAATTTTTLDNNSWGYALNNTSTYYAVPKLGETAAIIYDSSAAQSTILTIPVKFGIKTDNNLPSGTYASDVIYTMMPNSGCFSYGVTWDFAGGVAKSGATYPTSLEWGSPINLSQLRPTREGYTLIGWTNGADDFEATAYNANINPNDATSITITAKWRATCPSDISSSTVNLDVNGVVDYSYSGGARCAVLYNSGYYKLEVWGGQGGLTHVSTDKTVFQGGYGAYATGIYQIDESESIYIVVGGQASQTCATSGSSNCSGGYNGGAMGQRVCSTSGCSVWYSTMPSGGGGATHIATKNGLLSELVDDKDKVLIVAGGGGGSSGYVTGTSDPYYHYGYGGNGGGITGNDGTAGGNSLRDNCGGNGGTQDAGGAGCTRTSGAITNPGSFGAGGTEYGGGGGWYGGSASYRGGAGGGSSYIGNSRLLSSASLLKHMTCYSCTTSNAAATRTNTNTTTPSGTATPDVAKTGNGYARITYLGDTL